MLYFEEKPQVNIHSRTSFYVIPHLHKHVEVVLITEGSTVLTVNKCTKTLKEGDAAVIFPFEQHEFYDPENVRGYIIIADMEQYGELKDYFFGNRPKEHCFRDKDGLLLSLLKAGAEIKELGVPAEKEVMAGISTAVLSLVLSKLELTKYEHADISVTEKLLYICETCFKEELSLDILAKRTGVSKYHVSKIFNNSVGISFTDYIATVRVLASKHLLKETDMRITDIAAEAGFNTLRSFNRSFSAVTGSSPREYRKKHRKQPLP